MVTFTLLAFTGWHYLYSIPLAVISLFLILVILVQRGRGGGLTGALGGMGGQSAFGTKAGDLFTKITIVVAAIWILLSLLAIQRLARQGARPNAAAQRQGAQVDKDKSAPGDKGDAKATSSDKSGASGKKVPAAVPSLYDDEAESPAKSGTGSSKTSKNDTTE